MVTINSASSAQSSLGQGVPQGSVLGPLLFILYTTPFSSLISDSSVGHHMYANDNHLFISFVTSELSAQIAHQQATVDLVSLWMSSNLVSLNQSLHRLKFNSVSNIKSYLSPTKFFSLDSLLISTAFSTFNLAVLLALPTLSPANVLLFAHFSK
jgi:hypothetical protein